MTVTQMTLWGDHLTIVPSSASPIAGHWTADVECPHCGEITYAQSVGAVDRYVSDLFTQLAFDFGYRLNARNHNGYGHHTTETVWVEFPCCENVCSGYNCTNVLSSESEYGSGCEDCEACYECCECVRCEECETNITDSFCDGCASADRYVCSRHCDCESCAECGDRCRPDDDYYPYCGSYCHDSAREDEDDYEDCEDDGETEVVLTYQRALRLGRTFGLEIECVGIAKSKIARVLRAAGIDCHSESYNHATRPHWKVVEDGSVNDGYEVVSPILQGEDGYEQVRVVMAQLRANGAKVDRQCGIHVHFGLKGATRDDLANIVRFYVESASAIDSFHCASRRSSARHTYCKGNTLECVDALRNAQDLQAHCRYKDRYYAVNVNAFSKYETLEFRQHAGSTNALKVLSWIRFLDALISASASGERGQTDLANLLCVLTSYGLDDVSASYLTQRASDFAEKEGRTVSTESATCAHGFDVRNHGCVNS